MFIFYLQSCIIAAVTISWLGDWLKFHYQLAFLVAKKGRGLWRSGDFVHILMTLLKSYVKNSIFLNSKFALPLLLLLQGAFHFVVYSWF